MIERIGSAASYRLCGLPLGCEPFPFHACFDALPEQWWQDRLGAPLGAPLGAALVRGTDPHMLRTIWFALNDRSPTDLTQIGGRLIVPEGITTLAEADFNEQNHDKGASKYPMARL